MTTNMTRGVDDFAGFPDDRLFETVAEGIPLIVENALALDEAARRLHGEGEYRVSEVVRGFAEEEAAKVLILIDLVRCPPSGERRAEIAKRFYGHVAKRIYAIACSYPRTASFGELGELVADELRPYYLDGPNRVDWIFPRAIAAEREQDLYVDYVRDLTEDAGEHYWRVPHPRLIEPPDYETPDCVTLGRALSDVGAGFADGLAVIADLWRRFEPVPNTGRAELRKLIEATLNDLAAAGLGPADEVSRDVVLALWPFPLWPLEMKVGHGKRADLERARAERSKKIEWIERTEAERAPPPAIARHRVEALSAAFHAWQAEVDEKGLRSAREPNVDNRRELASYASLRDMYRVLTEEERAALLALAWFARERVEDWPRVYADAKQRVGPPDDEYDFGLGRDWLAGLDRWEAGPRPFKAGRWHRR